MNEAEKVNQESDVYLNKVELINYKSILKTEIDFKPGLNVIIGNNGSGKTNFLDYLNTVLSFNFEKIIGYNAELIFTGKNKYKFKIRDTISNWLIPKDSLQKKNISIQYAVNEELKLFDSIYDPEFLIEKDNINYEVFILKYGTPNKQLIVDQPTSINFGLTEFGLQVSEFDEESIFSISIYSKIISLLSLMKDFKSDEFNSQLIESLNQFFSILANELATYTNIKNIRLYPDFRVDLNNESKEIFLKNLYLEFYENFEWKTYDRLSDGTKRLFYLISEITSHLQNEIFNDNFSKRQKIILLEEPELGIHPHQLHKLMLFIKEQSKEKQIILTTHSPQVLDILNADELDRIIVCKYDQQLGTQLNHLTEEQIKKGQMYMQDEGFLSDYWVHSDLEPAS